MLCTILASPPFASRCMSTTICVTTICLASAVHCGSLIMKLQRWYWLVWQPVMAVVDVILSCFIVALELVGLLCYYLVVAASEPVPRLT